MVSLSLVLTFILLLSSKQTFSSRLMKSPARVADISVDDYPSFGRNSPVHDLGYPSFPSFQEALAAPPPPDMPLPPVPPQPDLPPVPPQPDMPLVPPQPDLPLVPPPPPFNDLEKPRFPLPVWPSLPDFPPFPFISQAPPSELISPRLDESNSWMPSTASNPQEFP